MLKRGIDFKIELTILVIKLIEEEKQHKRTPNFGIICEETWLHISIISDFLKKDHKY